MESDLDALHVFCGQEWWINRLATNEIQEVEKWRERFFQEALRHEFQWQGIPFQEKPQIALYYKGTLLDQTYEPDFLGHEQIIVELKAAKSLTDGHRAQVINYLKSTRKKLGLLANFGYHPKLEYERLVH